MKKILSLLLAFSLISSISISAFANEALPKEDTEVIVDNEVNEVIIPKDLSIFDLNDEKSHLEKLEITTTEENELQSAYYDITAYAQENNIPLNLELSTFINEYQSHLYKSVDEYKNVYYTLLIPMADDEPTTKSSDGSDYYYNIGTSLPSDVTPNYSKYNLLTTVQKGDVIYEANGGFGITGHIAIVEGFYYNAARDITYIRVIEAISDGVVRSLLDDTRVDDKDAHVLRVYDATASIKNEAVDFCVGEIGSSYFIDFKKDTSSSETDWYCSELVWAGYKNQGIDIECEPFLSEPGVTPRNIYRGDQVYFINFN